MDAIFEQKLRELIDHAEKQPAPAAYSVLNQLLGAYLVGAQNKFALHCSKFSPLRISGMEMKQIENSDAELKKSGYVN